MEGGGTFRQLLILWLEIGIKKALKNEKQHENLH